MGWWKSGPRSVDERDKAAMERRRQPRVGGQLKVRYSGSDAHKIVMGHAKIVDVSRNGFGLQGARGIKLGMELALFLELPDTKDTLCIPQAFVSWIDGRRCGVELRGVRDKELWGLECLAGQS